MIDEQAVAGRTALVLLASGLSTRFDGDKLLATLGDQSVLTYAARLGTTMPFAKRIAVVGNGQAGRTDICEAHNWSVVVNPNPLNGQGESVSLATKACLREQACHHMLVLLADMPFVTDDILRMLLSTASDADAVICTSGDLSAPPALFSRSMFADLAELKGDEGARVILKHSNSVRRVCVPGAALFDIDAFEDLALAESMLQHR